jgi:hypothetical protein
MKVALVYRQNRRKIALFTRKIVVKVVLSCIILFHLLGDDCQSIPTFFLQFFINPFRPNFSTYIDMQKNSVYNTL